MAKEWKPNFDPFSDATEKALIWVQLPTLSIKYYSLNFLMKLGEQIGRPVKIDQATDFANIGKFARMCVEVDFSK